MDEEYYVQAFASADAILDGIAESLLRQIFNSFEAQTLINNLHNLRGSVDFNGMAYFKILHQKKVIDEELLKKVRFFKEARNKVAHNITGEYELIDYSEMKDIPDQETLDKEVRKRARKRLNDAFTIFEELHSKGHEIYGKEKEYLLEGNSPTKGKQSNKKKQ